jgi:hypothetical protein
MNSSRLGSAYNNSIWIYPPFEDLSGLLVQMETLPSKGLSLNDYVNAVISYMKESSQDLNIVNSSETTLLGSILAHKLIYTYTDQGAVIVGMTIISMKNDRVYYFDYSAEAKKFREHLPTVQHIIDSFDIKKTDTTIPEPLETEGVDYLTYQNITCGIKVRYPVNWNNLETQDYNPDTTTNVVKFYSPIEGYSQFLKSYDMSIDVSSTQ